MSRSTEHILALMRGEGRGFRPALARFGLWILSLLYGLGVSAYWQLFRFGVLKRTRLGPVVISVGNLTVGGTGKTTAVARLVRTFRGAGLRPAVLSYGYRAASKVAIGVVSDGERVLMPVEESGDEANLLANELPETPVLIGRRRVLSGAEADRLFHPDVLVCDDAFQYWRLHRDIDLLLIDVVEPWGFGYVLPRGLLREPKGQARRADAAILTHCDLAEPARVAALEAELTAMGLRVWRSRHAPDCLTDLNGKHVGSPSDLEHASVLAVSSLGDPASFEATLRGLGATVKPRRFPDHHRYTAEEVADVQREAAEDGLSVVTTAKDAAKLRVFAGCGSWTILRVSLAVDDGESFDAWVLGSVKAHFANSSN